MQLTLVCPAGLRLRPASLGGRTGVPEEDRLHAEPPERAEGVDIRPISRDLESIKRIGRLCFRSYPDGEVGACGEAVVDIEAASAGEYGVQVPDACLVAEEGGEPVGAILVTNKPSWDDVEGLTFVAGLFVAPDKRGRGVGDAFVGAALAAVGCREVGLRVESENAAARRIYERHGFVVRWATGQRFEPRARGIAAVGVLRTDCSHPPCPGPRDRARRTAVSSLGSRRIAARISVLSS